MINTFYKNSNSNLEDFLSKFSTDTYQYANRIDPLALFDITFKFHPSVDDSIGGTSNKGGRNQTFLQQLITSNRFNLSPSLNGRLDGKNGNSPLVLELGFYVQNITVPKIQQNQGSDVDYFAGKYRAPGINVGPDNHTLTMDILNTEVPLIEKVFYPWMKEVTLPFWSYDTQPFSTATVVIDFSQHAYFKYVFLGVRPSMINTVQPSQDLGSAEPTRQVVFDFDFMYIVTSNDKRESSETSNTKNNLISNLKKKAKKIVKKTLKTATKKVKQSKTAAKNTFKSLIKK